MLISSRVILLYNGWRLLPRPNHIIAFQNCRSFMSIVLSNELIYVAVFDTGVLRALKICVRELAWKTAGVTNHKCVSIVEVVSCIVPVTEEVHHSDIRLSEEVVRVARFAIGPINDEVPPFTDIFDNLPQFTVEPPLFPYSSADIPIPSGCWMRYS